MATPFIEELVDYLVTQSIGTKGTDLFFDHMPDVAGTIVCLYDTGGTPPPAELPQRTPTVMVQVRSAKTEEYSDARLLAAKIHNLFHGMISVTLTNNHIETARAFGLPQSIGQDKNQRHLVSANYEFNTRAHTDSGEASTGFGGDKDPNLN